MSGDHTPYPWRACMGHNGAHEIRGPGGWTIATVFHTPDGRGEANADAIAGASVALDNYAKTASLIAEADKRVVDVLMWLDERGRNSRSFGSHADAYEIAARRLREALGRSENTDGKTSSGTGPNFSDIADDGPTAA